jgi:hypothetical protein
VNLPIRAQTCSCKVKPSIFFFFAWAQVATKRFPLFRAVPGGQSATTDKFDGPSGVLVCCEDHIIWKHMDQAAHRVPIPRRRNPLADPGAEPRGLIIVAAVMHKMKVWLCMLWYERWSLAHDGRVS